MNIKNLWCIVHSALIKRNCSGRWKNYACQACMDNVFCQVEEAICWCGGADTWRVHSSAKTTFLYLSSARWRRRLFNVHTLGRHLVHMLAWWRWHVTCAQLFKYDICFCLLTGGGSGCSHLWPSFGPPAGNPLRLGRPRCTSPILRRVCQPGLHGGPA